MLRTRNLTLSSTPTLLTTTDEVETDNTISVQNTSDTATLYLGGPSVSSTSYGIRLLSGQIWSADLGPYDKLYAVGTGTVSVLILER
ncbi:MAG: hypothetical protein RLY61_519 [Candidatus Parcubacteria bacterium]|jgi:hypothetical protein